MPMTRYFTDYAWLGGAQVAERVLIDVTGDRIAAVQVGVERPGDAAYLSGVTVPARPTRTVTHFTGRCAGAPTAAGGRSGPGVRICMRSPIGSIPTVTTRWRVRCTRRWPLPASPVSASFTICITGRAEWRTRTRMRWV